MPKLNISIQHELSQDEAVSRIKGLLGGVKKQFDNKIDNLCENWDGNICTFSFSAMGFAVSGTLNVKSSEIELTGNLPFAAGLFKGKIESTIRDRATTLLA